MVYKQDFDNYLKQHLKRPIFFVIVEWFKTRPMYSLGNMYSHRRYFDLKMKPVAEKDVPDSALIIQLGNNVLHQRFKDGKFYQIMGEYDRFEHELE